MEGADNRMSLRKRTAEPSLERLAYSASHMPAITPIGVAMAMPMKLITKLPTMALASPPSSP